MTQRELAAKSGIPVGTIRNYEQGRRIPRLPILIRIANTLQVPIDHLFVADPEHLRLPKLLHST